METATMSFVWPLAFLLLPLPLLVWYFLPSAVDPRQDGLQGARLKGALRVPFYQRLLQQNSSVKRKPQHSTFRAIWRASLAALIWLLLVTALARPVLEGPKMPLPATGRDLMMALDLSGSMEQSDLSIAGQNTTRLAVVKAAADDFLRRRQGDRVGLVLFSDRAYVQSPLTFDRQVVRELLDQAEVGLTGQKTAIGDAIAIAVKRLKNRPEESRVLVLLTDGANNAGVIDPIKAATLAKKLGIRIYTIGVGASAMTINTAFGLQQINPSQDLDERTLTDIAEMSGGQYFRATDVQGLAQVYRAIDKLEPSLADPLFVRPQIALYFWPMALAFALSMLFALLFLLPIALGQGLFLRKRSSNRLSDI